MDTLSPTVDTVPFDMVKTNTVRKMNLQVINVYLGKSATIHVSLLNENNMVVHSEMLSLTGDDYKAWGTDDQYIFTYVASKMGVLLPSIEKANL
jgi:hypothetical protein